MGNPNTQISTAQWASVNYCATGKVRQINEDSIMANNREQLWVVADGMGGHENGDYASRYVTDKLGTFRSTGDRNTSTAAADVYSIDQHLNQCNSHLVKKAEMEKKHVIGCTVAALLLHQDQAWCIWSGDSRIYRLRNSELDLLTRDHNFASLRTDQETSSQPNLDFADTFTHGEVLTGAIGGDDTLQTEQSCHSVQPGDEFLLCTDGLYREVSDDEIGQLLASGDTADESVEALAQLYLARGARDNVGMIHIYCDNQGNDSR